jgi:hypothetical protein
VATRKELSEERKRYQVALSNISDEASTLVGPSAAALSPRRHP